MFEKFDRSWALVQASASILKQDRSLLAFPAVSAVAVMLVIASFALPMGGMDAISNARHGTVTHAQYAILFLFYLTQYFVIFFFNTALVGAVMMRLDGETPTFGDGISLAASKIVPILGYTVIAATVGTVLRMIQDRVGFIGQIVVGVIGVAWSLATYLVVPVMAARDVGPFEAISESAELLKKTWGENVIGEAGMGIAFTFIYIGVAIVGALFLMSVSALNIQFLFIAASLVVISAMLLTALVHATLSGIYAAALYRYASDDEGTGSFDTASLENAFVEKD